MIFEIVLVACGLIMTFKAYSREGKSLSRR
jgi:hypothetical protein